MPSRYGEKPARPTAPKPVFTRKETLERDQFIAQFAFEGEQPGDLSFKKGDIIEVTKRSDSRNVPRPRFVLILILGLVDG
jgi:SH3 domain